MRLKGLIKEINKMDIKMSTLNELDKMKIAQDFISLHKEKMRLNWVQDLLNTYYLMEAGTYGEAHEEDSNFWIEIGRLDSETGNPVIFEWKAG